MDWPERSIQDVDGQQPGGRRSAAPATGRVGVDGSGRRVGGRGQPEQDDELPAQSPLQGEVARLAREGAHPRRGVALPV